MVYWAATAVYQEVQFLNRYVRHAAVRDGYRPWQVVARTTMVDAERGTELPERSDERVDALEAAVASRYGLKPEDVPSLLDAVQRNAQDEFTNALRKKAPKAAHPARRHATGLWLDLARLMVGAKTSGAVLDLPGHKDTGGPALFAEQAALVLDDGVRSIVTLRWGYALESLNLAALLVVEHEGRELSLSADEIHLDEIHLIDGGARARFVFLSLQAWGLEASAGKKDALRLVVAHRTKSQTYDALYRARSP